MNNNKLTSFDQSKTIHGVFFRWPIQKVNKHTDCWFSTDYDQNCFAWYKTALLKVIPFLLNIKLWFNFKKLINDDYSSIRVNELCSPIYFTRQLRLASHELHTHRSIKTIDVIGWEPYKNECDGAAEKEIATFRFRDGSERIVVTKKKFYYYYAHIINQEFINN